MSYFDDFDPSDHTEDALDFDNDYVEDYWDDEPADIDDDHGMNPYDGTYDYMEGQYDEW